MAQKHVYSHTPSKAPAWSRAEREDVALLDRHVDASAAASRRASATAASAKSNAVTR